MGKNDVFISRYNVLDHYCCKLAGISGRDSGIYLLEQVLDIERSSFLDSIRKFKNDFCSHVKTVAKPTAPQEYINFLNDEINYIKAHEKKMASLLKEAAQNSKKDKPKGNKPKKWSHADQYISAANSLSERNLSLTGSNIYRYVLQRRVCNSYDDVVLACVDYINDDFIKDEIARVREEYGCTMKWTLFNTKKVILDLAEKMVASLGKKEVNLIIALANQ